MKDKNKKCDCENIEQTEEQLETEQTCECEQTDGCENGCECNNECECQDCSCEKESESGQEKTDYLNDLLRVQAEFDNYRKRMTAQLAETRQDGFIDAIEQFLPALDSFKMATDMITDKNTLMGIKFIEKGILDTLSKMGVEQIDATGKFNPEMHQAIDTDSSSDVEEGYIVKECYKGFTYKGRVIRYSQVIVKK